MLDNLPSGPIEIDPDSKEYKLSTAAASTMRERTNQALGEILTLVELSFGDSEPTKAKKFKELVKQSFWRLTDDNQHTVYYAFGIEPYQLGDYDYTRDVHAGTDGERKLSVASALPSPNPYADSEDTDQE